MRAPFFRGLVHEPLDPACTLHVRGFSTETEAYFIQIFQKFGEVKSCRILGAKDGKSPSAFVNFKTPEQAAAALNVPKPLLNKNNQPLLVHVSAIQQVPVPAHEESKD